MVSDSETRLNPRAFHALTGRMLKFGRSVTTRSVPVSTLLPGLERLEKKLPQIYKELESRYLKSGSVLEPLSEASQNLVNGSTELLSLAVNQTDGNLGVGGTSELLRTGLSFLEGWQSGVLASFVQVEACRHLFLKLRGGESTLHDAVAPLRHMQTMFRVESARLDTETREIFAGLTEQIATVGVEVRETFGQQFEMVAENLQVFTRLTESISSQAQAVGRDLQVRKQAIAKALADLATELGKNSERGAELSAIGRTVSNATGNIIVALQSHDIVTQRMQHVSSGISQACSLLRSVDESVKAKASDSIGKAFYLLSVQRAQLSGVYEQIDTSEKSLGTAVADISSKVSGGSDSALLKEFKKLTDAANGSMQLSCEMLAEIRTLLELVTGLSREFYEALEPIGTVSTRLTGSLELLSNKMRVIALNAQVQAVQIGAGTGLEVLAAHIAEISRHISGFAESMAQDIGELAANIQELSTSFRGMTIEGLKELEALRESGAVHEEHLHSLRNTILTKLKSTEVALASLQDFTVALTEQSARRTAALDPIASAVAVLKTSSDDLKLRVQRSGIVQGPELDESQYCMASERAAHQETLRSLRTSGADTAEFARVPTAPDGSEAEADCSVELF